MKRARPSSNRKILLTSQNKRLLLSDDGVYRETNAIQEGATVRDTIGSKKYAMLWKPLQYKSIPPNCSICLTISGMNQDSSSEIIRNTGKAAFPLW